MRSSQFTVHTLAVLPLQMLFSLHHFTLCTRRKCRRAKKKEGKRLTTQNVVVNDIYGWQHYRNRVTIIVNKAEDSVYALMLEKTKPCHNTSKAKKRFEQRGWLSIHSELITRKKRMKKSTYITNRKRRTDSEKQREKAPLDGTQKKDKKQKGCVLWIEYLKLSCT